MSLALNPAADDLLLNAEEILFGWEITNRRLRRLVKEGKLRRVRRPGYQPYYPLSAVEFELGPWINDPRPRKRSGFEFGELAA